MIKKLFLAYSKQTDADVPRKRKRVSLFAAVMVGTLLLAACSSAAAGGNQPAAGESALPFDFEISTYQGEDVLGGQETSLSDVLAQGKPVVLNFWAGLCPPCRLEMPDLQAVNDEFGDQIVLLGLDVGPFTSLGSSDEGKALIQELGVTYPAGTTSDAQVVREYQITGMPSTFFIAPNGEVVRKWTGLLTEAKLTELVEELLEASGGS
jgi:thiol-disulfide isomerase/thioredoxin